MGANPDCDRSPGVMSGPKLSPAQLCVRVSWRVVSLVCLCVLFCFTSLVFVTSLAAPRSTLAPRARRHRVDVNYGKRCDLPRCNSSENSAVFTVGAPTTWPTTNNTIRFRHRFRSALQTLRIRVTLSSPPASWRRPAVPRQPPNSSAAPPSPERRFAPEVAACRLSSPPAEGARPI